MLESNGFLLIKTKTKDMGCK